MRHFSVPFFFNQMVTHGNNSLGRFLGQLHNTCPSPTLAAFFIEKLKFLIDKSNFVDTDLEGILKGAPGGESWALHLLASTWIFHNLEVAQIILFR